MFYCATIRLRLHSVIETFTAPTREYPLDSKGCYNVLTHALLVQKYWQVMSFLQY